MSPTSRCLVSHLENPQLGGILIGLDPKDGYRFKEDFLRCCEGRGILWDEKRQGNTFCDIKTRRRKTLEILKKYFQIWNGPEVAMPTGAQSHKLLSAVADMIKGAAPQAQIFPTEAHRPGPLWGVACALTWRFGMNVHMVSMARKGQTMQVPSDDVMSSSKPLAIICEQVRRLTDRHEVTQLESLINLAYQSNAFLWIEVMTQRPASRTFGKQETYMARRARAQVNDIRKKPLMEYLKDHLSSEAMSQLESLARLPRVVSQKPGVDDGLLSLD